MKVIAMKIPKFIIIPLILFIMMSTAMAVIEVQTYDSNTNFDISTGQDSIKICSCTSTTDSFRVINSGTYAAIFYLSSNDVSFSESTFSLDPGKYKDVPLIINSECKTGKKLITITVKNNLGVEKSFTKIITFEKCQNIDLRMNAPEKTMACQPAKYTLFVTNIGSFPEEYELSSNYDNKMTYTSKRFSLFPGQMAAVNATLQFDCSVYGEKEIRFYAQSLKNGLQASISAKLLIDPDYAYDVKINGQFNNNAVDACNRVYETTYPITIINYGVANDYKISFRNLPSFAKYYGDEVIHLEKGESKTVILNVDTHNYRDEVKTFKLSMNIQQQVGRMNREVPIFLNIKPCYEHTVEIINANEKNKPLKTCSADFYEYDVRVSNNGVYEENIKLGIEGGTANTELSSDTLLIGPKDSKLIKLYIIGPDTNFKYDVEVIATLANGITASDDTWTQAYDKQTCHKLLIEDQNFRINYDTKDIEIDAENKGLYPDEYQVILNDTTIVEPKNDTIYLGKDKVILNTKQAGLPEGKYDVLLTIRHDSGAEYTKDLHITLKDKSFFTKMFEYLFFGNTCRQFSFWELAAIIILCILIILFMMFGPHYPYKLKNRIKQKWPVLLVLGILFVIAVVFVVIFLGLPKTSEGTYNINTDIKALRFEWLENERYILDAKQFFSDPDANKLRFEVSEIRNIRTTVKGGDIYFYPMLNWYGNRTFTITAFDDQGGRLESPEMTAVVIQKPGRSFSEWYGIYCWYANLLILLLIMFLIAVIFIIKQKKRGRR